MIGIHADANLEINNGTINITKSYEGIESSIISINNGTINIISSDDGINVAGGNDSSSINGRPGQNNFSSSPNNSKNLTINDGKIYVNSVGDGLDANGSIYINGGITYVDGPTDNGNGSLDYDDICKVTGGTLIATGSSGMLQTPTTDSNIYTISTVFSGSQAANTKITIKDADEKEIMSYSPAKTFNSIVISLEKFKKGETYTIYVNDTKFDSITIENVVNSIGKSAGGMNGGGNMGPQGGKIR